MLNFVKKMLSIMFLLFLTTPVIEYNNTYLDDVKEAYEYYLVTDYDNNNYSINIIKGIVNGEATYGISFYSMNPNEYYVRFLINDIEYFTKSSSGRGDLNVVAINWKNYDKITLHIYDKNGNLQSPVHQTVLEKYDKETFIKNGIFKLGDNKGVKETTLKNGSELQTQDIVRIAMLAVIIIMIVIIGIAFINKRGKFNKGKRQEGVFDFKSFIENEVNNNDLNDTNEEDNPWLGIENNKKNNNILDVEAKEVYNKSIRYSDDETSDFDIAKHLQDLGYVTNYSIASEDEKNQIMMELMQLRDTKKITNDEYLEEAYKLWKK